MEDSLKGSLIALVLSGIFITAILSFIVLFPQEQGVVFSDPSSQSDYLVVNQTAYNSVTDTTSQLGSLNNATSDAFNQWDVTVGFMGSNTMKQSSAGGITTMVKKVFSTLITLATQIFGANSAVIYVLGTLLLAALSYLTYQFFTFVRTGR
jgi:hypothetical protein